MDQVTQIAQLRQKVRKAKLEGKRVGFVPTMGALHAGHLSLVNLARSRADYVVASIFVNPTQFNDRRDYDLYPRELEHDCELLVDTGLDLVFMPDSAAVYGENYKSAVSVSGLSEKFEGKSRPGHFQGVTTVVSILFNMVEPDLAVFGEKDFQQLAIIEQMVADLKFPIEIVHAPLIRDSDGLALSSRNARLSKAGRQTALSISKGLFAAAEQFKKGEVNAAKLSWGVREKIEGAGGEPDYVEVVDDRTLEPLASAQAGNRILVAAVVEGVRLIDNIAL